MQFEELWLYPDGPLSPQGNWTPTGGGDPTGQISAHHWIASGLTPEGNENSVAIAAADFSKPFSLEVDVAMSQPATGSVFFDAWIGLDPTDNAGVGIELDDSDAVNATLFLYDSTGTILTVAIPFTRGSSHTIRVDYTPSNMELTVDGSSLGSAAAVIPTQKVVGIFASLPDLLTTSPSCSRLSFDGMAM